MSYIRDLKKMKKLKISHSQYATKQPLFVKKFPKQNLFKYTSINNNQSIRKVSQNRISLHKQTNNQIHNKRSASYNHRKYLKSQISTHNYQKLTKNSSIDQLSVKDQRLQNIVNSGMQKNMESKFKNRSSLYFHRKYKIKRQVGYQDFQMLFIVGKGTFGKVWKALHKEYNRYFAIKQISQTQQNNQYIKNQRNILTKIKSSFIIKMHWFFHYQNHYYFVMDYLDGGSLKYHMKRRKRFSENQAKFFIANIVIGLEHLRDKNIIHRDIKPENIIFDNNGYLRLTDFGLSRYFKPQNYQENSGTPNYMAPQVLLSKNHSFSADYYALGIVLYELMFGKKPHYGNNQSQILQSIKQNRILIGRKDLPYKWSFDCADFLNKILTFNKKQRLGQDSIAQIKNHTWFKDIQWQKLENQDIQAPFIPRSFEQNLQNSQYKFGNQQIIQPDKNRFQQKQNFETMNKGIWHSIINKKSLNKLCVQQI